MTAEAKDSKAVEVGKALQGCGCLLFLLGAAILAFFILVL